MARFAIPDGWTVQAFALDCAAEQEACLRRQFGGEVIERVPNPRPLETALRELRHLSRERSRRTQGSRRYRETQRKITRLQRRVASIRGHHVHALTTRLAKTRGPVALTAQQCKKPCGIATVMHGAELAWRNELAATTVADLIGNAPAVSARRAARWLGERARPGLARSGR
jgi:hypothetical protein